MSDNEVSEFINLCTLEDYEPKSAFIKSGEIPRKFGFVISGLFRYVYASEKGHEFTKGFMPENNFISSYSAMVTQTPSPYLVEALERSSILSVTYQDWNKLTKINPGWRELLLVLLEKGYMVKEKRERELLLYDAETRYRIFLEEHPRLETRIKQHMIASYLGITPIALSRIRKRMKT